jgi:hypothetical protein
VVINGMPKPSLIFLALNKRPHLIGFGFGLASQSYHHFHFFWV